MGEVVFIQRDCVDSGKLYRAEFSLNKKISFGGNSSNCQEGRGAGFLDFSYYTLSGNEVTHNYSNKQSKFTASEIITLSDQDKAILVYEQDLGLLINHSKLGVLVNLKNTTFPGLAFLSEDVSN